MKTISTIKDAYDAYEASGRFDGRNVLIHIKGEEPMHIDEVQASRFATARVCNISINDNEAMDHIWIYARVTVTNALKERRNAAGMSQSKLAHASGVNVRMIQKYEQGESDLFKAQAGTVLSLAKALNCSVEDLI